MRLHIWSRNKSPNNLNDTDHATFLFNVAYKDFIAKHELHSQHEHTLEVFSNNAFLSVGLVIIDPINR